MPHGQLGTLQSVDVARILLISPLPRGHRTYYVSTPQHARNMQACGASVLGEGTLVVRAEPGHGGGFAESGLASVTQFQAHKIQSSVCGDELTIWVSRKGKGHCRTGNGADISSVWR